MPVLSAAVGAVAAALGAAALHAAVSMVAALAALGAVAVTVAPFESAEQVPFGLSPHEKPAGQSVSALHVIVFKLHDFVPLD